MESAKTEVIAAEPTVPASRVEPIYPPCSFEAHDPMPPEYHGLVVRLIKETGEFASSEGFNRYLRELVTRVIDMAPNIADRVTVAEFYADENRHGFIMEGLLRELGVDPVKEFGSGFLTSIEALHLLLTDIHTWTDFALSTFLLDRAAAIQFSTYHKCSYAPMSRVGPRMEHDERGHCTMGHFFLKEICATREGRADAQQLLAKWYPTSLDMFGKSNGRRQWEYIRFGLKSGSNEELRRRFVAEVTPLIAELGLEVPDEHAGRKVL